MRFSFLKKKKFFISTRKILFFQNVTYSFSKISKNTAPFGILEKESQVKFILKIPQNTI